MKQQTLATAGGFGSGFEQYRRPTRRDKFLAKMDEIVPWAKLCAVIEPYYPKAGGGCPPVGLERMLRMYCVQHGFNLADEACEESLLDSQVLCRFVGIDLGRERVPDATTLLRFRRLLERHELGAKLFDEIGGHLQDEGLSIGTGTIVDATLISAPSSTKNREKTRDPEMHQTRKARQWYFGMKMHIGVDSRTGLVHSAGVTAANVHDKHLLGDLFTARSTACTATAPTPARKQSFTSMPPRRRTSPTSESKGAAWSMKPSVCATAINREYAPAWSISLPSPNANGASTKCAIAGLRRTPRAALWSWGWPICTWPEGI